MVSGFFVACIARQLLERALIFNNLKPCDGIGTNRQISDLSADAIRDECKGVAAAVWSQQPLASFRVHLENTYPAPKGKRPRREGKCGSLAHGYAVLRAGSRVLGSLEMKFAELRSLAVLVSLIRSTSLVQIQPPQPPFFVSVV